MNKVYLFYYLTVFVYGVGCFCISLKKQKSSKVRWVLYPVFHVTQHEDQKEILEMLQKVTGCGKIIKKYGQENTLQFYVHSRKDLIECIIPFFRKYELITKKKDFEIFAEIVEALAEHHHGNIEKFRELLKKAFTMNRNGKQRRYNLNNVLNSLGSSETIRQIQSK